MIGRLQGKLLEKSKEQVLLDVSGVAYEVEIPRSTFGLLGEQGSDLKLHTHLVVREDAHLLFGFFTLRERELFRTLIRVNKVGPKLALAILSGLSVEALIRAIRHEDVKTLSGISGVGKVTAERVILELRNKLTQWEVEMPALSVVASRREALVDAEAALISLGYKPQDASRALARIDSPADDVESLIRQALKALS